MSEERVIPYNSVLQQEAEAKISKGYEWLPGALASPWQRETRAFFRYGNGEYKDDFLTPESLVERLGGMFSEGTGIFTSPPAVCVIENVSPRWIEVLGKTFNIKPSFFLEHARQPDKNDPWQSSFSLGNTNNSGFCVHASGVFEYNGWKSAKKMDSSPNFMQRLCWEGPEPYPASSHTFLSYLKLYPNTCLVTPPSKTRS
jgi:hypothetical protein